MSAGKTRLNYIELDQISKQFQKNADDVANLNARTRQKMSVLRGIWVGDAAKAFFNEMDNQILPAAQRVSLAYLEAEKVLNNVAQIMNDADTETASYFKDLGSYQSVGSKDGTPTQIPGIANNHNQLEQAIETLDNLLKPIDWISDSKKATKIFELTLADIGRFANSVTGETGHIKEMTELGHTLTGVTKVVGVVGNVLTLRDYSNYFNGKITNHEVADSAIKVIIPIPILNAKISEWLQQNMPDPNGHWQGLVTEVRSD